MDSTKTSSRGRYPYHNPPVADAAGNQSSTSSSSSSSLNGSFKSRAARFDAQMNSKALSRSVIAESLDYFLPKSNNASLQRTVSDSSKMKPVNFVVELNPKPKVNQNPDKERKKKLFYGGEIVKLIYESSKEKTRRKSANLVKQDSNQKPAEEDLEEVKRMAKLEIVEVKGLKKEVRNGEENGDLKRVSVGRRRSFCGTETSLTSFLSSNGARIVAVDMPPFMQIHAIDCARKAYDSLEKFTSKSLALSLKKEFDGVYGPAWHCIVGTSFGSFVTHSVGGFLYFSLDHKMYILLFKTTVQRAD